MVLFKEILFGWRVFFVELVVVVSGLKPAVLVSVFRNTIFGFAHGCSFVISVSFNVRF